MEYFIIYRKASSSDPVPEKELSTIAEEVYNKEIATQSCTQENIGKLLSIYSNGYKNKLEQTYSGHQYFIYTMFAQCGELMGRSVDLIKSDPKFDTGIYMYVGAVKADGADTFSFVSAMKERKGKISPEIKNSKGTLEANAKKIIEDNIQGKRFNETGNKMIAKTISRSIKDLIVNEIRTCNCTIGTIIIKPNIVYNENVIFTAGKDIEIIQVQYKNEEFNVISIIALVPSS